MATPKKKTTAKPAVKKAAEKASPASPEREKVQADKAAFDLPVKGEKTLLERKHKVILKDGDSVLKVFDSAYKVSAILNEAMNEARAAETGLPVAKIIEVMKLGENWCIRREYVEGKTLADAMEADKKNLSKYLRQFVAIQCEIFKKSSERMGNLADKLDKQISASALPRETRYDLHMKLQSFPRGKALCHGDFNPTNVLITEGGEWRVIDWAHVRLGDPLADVARTYLLFWLSGHIAAADKYLALACSALSVSIPDVQRWLPIVAAAEASKENSPKNRELLIHWASVVDYE